MKRETLREPARHARAFLERWLARASGRRVGVVLVYHGIAPATGDRRTEIVPPVGRATFEWHVRHLARKYAIVAPSAIPTAVAQRRRGARIPVALTFDDDLASHVDEAAPILRRHHAVAAFFVCGASLDAPGRFWWEELQEALDTHLLDDVDLGAISPQLGRAAAEVRERGVASLVRVIEELSPALRAAVARSLRERVGEAPRTAGLRRNGIEALAAEHEIGFHTLRHDRLPPLDDVALDTALEEGRHALQMVVGRPLTAISYPHGRADARVGDAARRHGFVTGFTGGSQAVTAEDDNLLLPRIEPTTIGRGAFASQIARHAAGRVPRR